MYNLKIYDIKVLLYLKNDNDNPECEIRELMKQMHFLSMLTTGTFTKTTKAHKDTPHFDAIRIATSQWAAAAH